MYQLGFMCIEFINLTHNNPKIRESYPHTTTTSKQHHTDTAPHTPADPSQELEVHVAAVGRLCDIVGGYRYLSDMRGVGQGVFSLVL